MCLALCHFILFYSHNNASRYYYYPCFTNDETENAGRTSPDHRQVRLKSKRTCWCSPWKETLGSDVKLCCWRASDLGHIPYMEAGIHGKTLITYMSMYCIVRSSQIILWEIILYFSPKAWNILKGMKPLSWEGIWQLLRHEQPLKVCSLFLHEKVIWHPQLRSLNTFAQIVPSIKTFLSINLPTYSCTVHKNNYIEISYDIKA